jgi:hypothetical protein
VIIILEVEPYLKSDEEDLCSKNNDILVLLHNLRRQSKDAWYFIWSERFGCNYCNYCNIIGCPRHYDTNMINAKGSRCK